MAQLTCSVERLFDEVLVVAVDGDGLDAADEVDRRQLTGTIQDCRLVGYSAEVEVVVVEHQRAEDEERINSMKNWSAAVKSFPISPHIF